MPGNSDPLLSSPIAVPSSIAAPSSVDPILLACHQASPAARRQTSARPHNAWFGAAHAGSGEISSAAQIGGYASAVALTTGLIWRRSHRLACLRECGG